MCLWYPVELSNMGSLPLKQEGADDGGRADPTQDYWDLTLLAIYQYYTSSGNTAALAGLFRRDGVQHWLKSFLGGGSPLC